MTDRRSHCDLDRPAGPDSQSGTTPSAPRRRVLQAAAAGGSALLAGCGWYGSGSTGGPDRVRSEPFRAPIGDDPSKTTFLPRHGLRPQSLYGWDSASIHLQRFLFETGVWPTALWPNDGAGVRYTWIEDPIEITPTAVTIRIRDDARWSDGNHITAKDVACIPLSNTIRANRPPYFADDDMDEPSNLHQAIDGFDISKKEVTYRCSAGFFGDFWPLHVRKRLGTFYGPHLVPTHLEPYRQYANAVTVTANRALAGAIDPWTRNPDDPHKRSLIRRYVRDIEHARAFSEPETVVGTGAWDLVALRGSQEFVFAPNEYHRHAGRLNFDSFVLEYTPSVNRMNAALTSDRLDYASTYWGRVGGYTRTSVVESFPDAISQVRIPGGIYTGNELGLNFHHPALAQRPVRQALMYALDHEAIAGNLHRTAAVPVTTPGGDCWDATDYVGPEWIDQALTTYAFDRERAAERMRAAGYTRTGGRWTDADGAPLTFALATASETPRWEPTVASQLTEFGIETDVATMGEVTLSERVGSGEFPLWATRLNSLTNKAPATLFIWHVAPENHHQYGIYPDEQFQTGEFSEHGMPLPHTAERFSVFTIEAPPIGEPRGPVREYHPSAAALSLRRTSSEEFRRRVRMGMWLANWFVPTVPLTKKIEQHFVDDSHWNWPRDSASWDAFTGGGPRVSSGLFAGGRLRANPDNPEGTQTGNQG